MKSINHKSGGRMLGYTFATALAALLLPAAAGHGLLTSVAFAEDGGGDHDGGDHDGGGGGGESGGGDHSGSGGDSSRGGGDDSGGDDHGGDDRGGDDRGGDDDSARNGAEHVDSATGTKAERNGDDIEVVYASGIKEEIQGGRYEMKDARGRTVTERRATAADRKRLSALLP